MLKSYPFSTNFLGYSAIGFISVSLLCCILALGLPYWEMYDETLGDLVTKTTGGLFTYCIDYEPETEFTDICGSYGDLAGVNVTGVWATVAMLIIGIVLAISTLEATILSTFCWKTKILIHYVAFILGLAAGLFLLLSWAIYAGAVKQSNYDPGPSLSLNIIAWIMTWTSAAFILVMARVKIED